MTRATEPAPLEALPTELAASLEKVSRLVQKICGENPGPHPLGLTGNDTCPHCWGIARWSILASGGVYLECISSGCFNTHSRPSGGEARRKPDNTQGRLL